MTVSGHTFTASSSADVVTITPAPFNNFTATLAVTATSSTVTTTQAVGTMKISTLTSPSAVSSMKVAGVEILSATINGTGTNGTARRAMATAIVNRINSFVSSPDFTAASDGASTPTITITAVVGGAGGNGSLNISKSNVGLSSSNLAGGGTSTTTGTGNIKIASFYGGVSIVPTFDRVDIVPSTASYAKAASRIDCVGATCTYAEEMTNFANWYAYYRTRMQMMKSAASLAFKDIDTRFRVGFYTINNPTSNYLPIAIFDNTQKANWYTKLFSINPGSPTPLRSALTTVGRIFAGKHPLSGFSSDDPMQYSCQQNFTLLTTDGYWNTDSASAVKNITGAGSVGNMDGGTTERPLFEGPTASSETLADAAKYYYDTDLRDSSLSNCTGTPVAPATTGVDVCQNNVFTSNTDNNTQQHMTTFTLGLGVDGTLNYDPDYKSQTSGDFKDLTNGSINWPVPAADQQTAVDDLWHAAVNGHGTYFSAKNPTQLSDSLSNALSQITSKVGAGAAAATSTLNPVTGNNAAFVASYATVKWTGNIEARDINVVTGAVSPDANWCIEDVAATTCATALFVDSTVTPHISYCPKSGIVSSVCTATVGNVFDSATSTCRVPVATSCNGTLTQNPPSGMPVRVSASTDTRSVLMNVSGTLASFSLANLTATANDANFQTSFLATNLSQWSSLTAAQKLLVTPDKLVGFLRGQFGYEDRFSNSPPTTTADNRLFRFREAVLGDAIESTPAYVGVPKAQYTDAGYGSISVSGTFAATQSARDGTVYVGTNDGMLHAFDEDNGAERWTYVPSMVLPNLWRLADQNYSSLHTNYINGDPIINDVCTANCSTASATWKTILVAGLNGGGAGYYALDITDPSNPNLLWEFDSSDDSDIGYSFGNPVITKKADGTWVVVVTSGYNNDTNLGKGFLYVLDVNPKSTGPAGRANVLTKYSTGVGSAATPSGLAKIAGFVQDAAKNNTALNIYGGDLLGNLWRFDINAAQSSTNPFLMATLTGPKSVVNNVVVDSTLIPQPITTKPELSEVNGDRIVFVGTGKYLESSDLSDTSRQTLYGIKDNSTSTLANPRNDSTMVQQTLTDSGSTRTVSNNPVAITKRGWFIDLPDTGERQNVPSQLVFGTLLVPTIVPSNTVCSPGGFGWLNFLNFQTGAVISTNVAGSRTNAPIVGINVLYVNGNPKVELVTSDNPTPQFPAVQPTFTGGSVSGFQQHRVIWRELLDQQQ